MVTVFFSESLIFTCESTRRYNPGQKHRELRSCAEITDILPGKIGECLTGLLSKRGRGMFPSVIHFVLNIMCLIHHLIPSILE
jgi:hypothetical protein